MNPYRPLSPISSRPRWIVSTHLFEKPSNPPSSPFQRGKIRNLSAKAFRKALLPLKNEDGRDFWADTSKKKIISKLAGRSDPFSCCPGKKAGAEAKKGREKSSLFPPPCLRKETRWPRDTRAETAEARIGKRGTTAFFGPAKRGTFLPGQGTRLLQGTASIRRTS